MNTIRVLLAVDSPMLRELLKDRIQPQRDIEVVGEAADPVDLLLAVRATDADVVIHTWPESTEAPGICSHLLTEYAGLLVIGIPPDEDRAYACHQAISTTRLPTAGLEEMLAEIRQTVPALK